MIAANQVIALKPRKVVNPKELLRLEAMVAPEKPMWEQGLLVGGADEVGRGPLAGPVVVAAVVSPPWSLIEGVNDSKKVTQNRREVLYDLILENALSYGIGLVDEGVIDQINILNATLSAFELAYSSMEIKPGHMLLDAIGNINIAAKQHSLIHGDALSYTIAAASIVAKVTRDRLMEWYSVLYPQYGFERNKGYGTQDHIKAIREFGPCPIHRVSFLKNIL